MGEHRQSYATVARQGHMSDGGDYARDSQRWVSNAFLVRSEDPGRIGPGGRRRYRESQPISARNDQ